VQFTRDRFTWLAYLMLAYFSYIMSAPGPLMPFLRAELGLNYTIAALHMSAFALGMTAAGFFGDRIAERFGRTRVFWGGAFGMGAGTLLFISVPHVVATITGTLLMGFLGTLLLVMIQATLSDKYGSLRSIALTESNVAASIAAVLVPIVIGFGEGTGIGWRIALWLAIAVLIVVTLAFRGQSIPAAAPTAVRAQQPTRPLPSSFWIYWLVIFFSVSIEWCLGFWGADFLENGVGLERVTASTLVSVFFGAMVVGRILGSRLTRSMNSVTLLIGAAVIVTLGFPIFWLAQTPLLNVAGLFITGVGIANLYPLTLSVTTSLDPENSNKASARSSMGAGLAVLIMPQVLGWVADQIEISGAFGITALLALIVLGLTLFARRSARVPVAAA